MNVKLEIILEIEMLISYYYGYVRLTHVSCPVLDNFTIECLKLYLFIIIKVQVKWIF